MTIAQKIISSHCNRKEVTPGEIVLAKVDLVMGSELSTIIAIPEFEKIGVRKVFNKSKIAIIPDHFTPNKDIKTAEICTAVKEFVKKYEIKNYFEVGRGGIQHVVVPEEGLIESGYLIVGADSHTVTLGALGCFAAGIGSTDMAFAMATGELWFKVPHSIKIKFTGRMQEWVFAKDIILHLISKLGVEGARYRSVEFCGDVVKQLDMSSRFTLTNMSAEIGAKAGVIETDEKTFSYLKKVTGKSNFKKIKSSSDDEYEKVYEIDVSELEPQIACPPSPENVQPISNINNVKLTQVLIGSCTNGRLEDLRISAEILKKRKVHPDVILIILPGSQSVYKEAAKEGLLEIFVRAGAVVSTPTCGPCIGGHMGVLGPNDVCLSTINRNFPGRMGHKDAKVYLSSPAVASASAIAGCIIHPKYVFPKMFHLVEKRQFVM